MHRIHESADARRFGVALISDFHPDVGARLAKTGIEFALTDAFMPLFANFRDFKFHSHRQISQAAYCSAIALIHICKLFGLAVFDPIQF